MDILIVDDNVSLTRIMGRVFAKQGYSTRSATTVRQALRLGRHHPRVALIDLHLPDGNGVDLAVQLRSDEAEILCLLMTAGSVNRHGLLAPEGPFIRILSKPFNLPDLRQALEEVLTMMPTNNVPAGGTESHGNTPAVERVPGFEHWVPHTSRLGGILRTAMLLVLLTSIGLGVAAVLFGVPMPWHKEAGKDSAKEAGKEPLAVDLVKEIPHTLLVPEDVQRGLSIRHGSVEEIATAQVPTQMRALQLPGSTALDPARIIRSRIRFAPAETVSIKMVPDSQTTPTQSHEVRPGDEVKKGQELAVLLSADVGNKKNDLFEAIVQLRLDRVILDKAEDSNGSVPEWFLWNARGTVEKDRSAVSRARATLKTWDIPEEDIAAVEKEANQLGIIQGRRQDDKEADWTKKHNDWARVILRAPADGVIVERNISAGETVIDNTLNLFTVAKVDQLLLRVDCPEDVLPDFYRLRQEAAKIGQKMTWSVETVGTANKKGMSGTIEEIGWLIDPNQHTAVIKGYINNPGEMIRAGQFVSATVELPAPKGVVEIPMDAIVDDGNQTVVFVQSKQDKLQFTMRRVQVTHRFEKTAFIRSTDIPKDEQLTAEEREEGLLPKQPLTEGERVLTRGSAELKAALLDKEQSDKDSK